MKTLPVLCCRPGSPPLEAAAAEQLALQFKALADPARVSIVNRLSLDGECCVCAFVDDLELAQPTVSHHLRILREAGLVAATRRGTWSWYRLVPGALDRLRTALAA